MHHCRLDRQSSQIQSRPRADTSRYGCPVGVGHDKKRNPGCQLAVGYRSYSFVCLLWERTPIRETFRRSIAVGYRSHSLSQQNSIRCRHANGLDHTVACEDSDDVELLAVSFDNARRNHLGVVLARNALGHLAQAVGKRSRGRKRKCQHQAEQRRPSQYRQMLPNGGCSIHDPDSTRTGLIGAEPSAAFAGYREVHNQGASGVRRPLRLRLCSAVVIRFDAPLGAKARKLFFLEP